MTQDRFTEGGRNIVWKAVQEALNGHRRRDPLAKGLFLKFERIDWSADSQKPDWWEDWEPGQPDKPQLSEDDIQAFIADIAADVCRRVEETLDKIDPREAPEPVEKSAEEKAKERWVSGPVKVWDGPSGSEVTVDALAEDQPLGGQSLSHVTKAAWNEVRRREREDAIHPCTNWRADICDCKGACSCHWVQPEETIKRTEIPIKRLGSTEEVRLHGPVIKGAPGKPGKHSDAIEASKPVEWPEGELVEVEATESMGPAAVHDAADKARERWRVDGKDMDYCPPEELGAEIEYEPAELFEFEADEAMGPSGVCERLMEMEKATKAAGYQDIDRTVDNQKLADMPTLSAEEMEKAIKDAADAGKTEPLARPKDMILRPDEYEKVRETIEGEAFPLGPVSQAPAAGAYVGRPPRTAEEMRQPAEWESKCSCDQMDPGKQCAYCLEKMSAALGGDSDE
jgi:hypothetical protein